jgi:membrane-associated phospholipid phosphatase
MLKIIQIHWRFFIGYLLFFIAGGILQLIYSKTELFLFFNSHFSSFSDFFFKYWTNAGDGLFSIAIAVILVLFVSYKKGLIVAVGYAVSSLSAQLLKRVFFPDALRPKAYFDGKSVSLHFTEGVEVFSYNSFPSGHSATAFALFCTLCFIIDKKHLEWLWLAMALLVAYSRMYLAEHFFEDIYVGSFIGVTTALVVQFLFNKIPEKSWFHKSLLSKS